MQTSGNIVETGGTEGRTEPEEYRGQNNLNVDILSLFYFNILELID